MGIERICIGVFFAALVVTVLAGAYFLASLIGERRERERNLADKTLAQTISKD